MSIRVEIWLHGLTATDPPNSWGAFTAALMARFDDLSITNVISDFNKLTQTTSVNDYIDKFEDGFMVSLGRTYDETY
ncbi:hypothetical protein LIER_43702 [Lithospermum erythrorhizon]|uniref:Retrotransposon gag domain-containing protein n=1 Tax=Lithospermum erythrorhizon TaxID=34254 RepID=A0AAV3QNE4_LITER